MKFDIKDKKKNPLMKRDEVIVSIDHAGKATPNRLLVLSEIAKLVKNKPENIIINRITTPGGSTISEVKVFSYSKKDDIPEWRLKKMEQRASKVKGKPKEEAPKEPVHEKPEQEENKESGQAGETSDNKEEKPADEEQPSSEGESTGEKPEEASQEDKKPTEASGEEKKEETSGEAPADAAEKPSTEDKQGDAEEDTPQGIPSRAQAGKPSVEGKEKKEGS